MSSRILKLFKNDKDTTSPVDEVILPNHVKAVVETAEDIMAIPHSFKLVFKDYDEEPYLFYCDEEVSTAKCLSDGAMLICALND